MLKFADNSIVSESGSGLHDVFNAKVLPDGRIDLVKTGVEDIHAKIQAEKACTDMSYIIAKIESGDMSVIDDRNAMYGDFTTMPSNLAEMMQLQIDANRMFDSLPVEVKKEFDNDRNKFFASSGSEEWFKKVSPVLSPEMREALNPVKPVVVEPVVPVTSVVNEVKE